MINKFYVYQLRREDEQLPFYIGKGQGNRNVHHFFPKSREKMNWKNNLITKAEKEGVKVLSEILCYGMEENDAFLLETKLIKGLGRRDIGTGILANMTEGGGGPSGIKRSDETRKRMSEAAFARVETRPVRGPLPLETRQKCSAARKGRPLSDAHRAALKGKVISKEQIEKFKASLKLVPNQTCPYCGLSSIPGNIARWHGEKCKHKPKQEGEIS